MNELKSHAPPLPACLVKLHPPHIGAAQLDSAMEHWWTKHHFSVEFNCSFVLCSVMYDWRSTHCSPHYDFNIIALEGFNAPRFLLFREITELAKWSDHLKWKMTNVFPAKHGGIVDLCHRRMRVELFFSLAEKKTSTSGFILKILHRFQSVRLAENVFMWTDYFVYFFIIFCYTFPCCCT